MTARTRAGYARRIKGVVGARSTRHPLASVGTLVLGLRCSCVGITADASRLARAVQKASAPENRLIGAGLLHRTFLSFEDSMHTLIIMDHTGDSRLHFDPNDYVEVLDAERRFRELSKAGYTIPQQNGRPTARPR
jgi:hypothetical protein